MVKNLLWVASGYLIGSLNWGLIIGKTFYNTDIRNYGSGNLGGTNATRVLGKKAGYTVIVLDAVKALVIMIFAYFFNKDVITYVGLAACVGHCFPIFAGFKGGKAVASGYGYLIGLSILVSDNLLIFFLPFSIFLLCLLTSRMVSLSSMVSMITAGIYTLYLDLNMGISVSLLAIFIIYRHQANIKRIIAGNESKIGQKNK